MARVTMEWHGDQAIWAGERGLEEGLDDALEHLQGRSQAIVPHEEGILELTATPSRDGLRGAVSYDTVYAARQHEELTWRHDPGRSAKYLETPLHADEEERNQLIAARVRRALRS